MTVLRDACEPIRIPGVNLTSRYLVEALSRSVSLPPPPQIRLLHHVMKDGLQELLSLIGVEPSRIGHQGAPSPSACGPHHSRPPHPHPNAVCLLPRSQTPGAGSTALSSTLKIKSHNLNKHKPESFLHTDLHEPWDMLFYQETTSETLLPFGWHAQNMFPKIYSSLGEGGAEDACIAVTDALSPFVTLYKSLCPGALCTAIMHLSGFEPTLLISVYTQPPRRTEFERALNSLFQQFRLWISGGDLNAQLPSLDTYGKTTNRWNRLTALVDERREAIDTVCILHQLTITYTRYKNQLLRCDTRIDFIFLSQPLISTPSLSLTGASVIQHDVTSDHHPISATVSLPLTPSHPIP